MTSTTNDKLVARNALLAGQDDVALAILRNSHHMTGEAERVLAEIKLSLHAPTVGDILVCSWGYDQTNIDWYQVVSVTTSKASVRLRKIAGKLVPSTRRGQDTVLPSKDSFFAPRELRYRDDQNDPGKLEPERDPKPEYTEKGLLKRVDRTGDGGYSVSMNSYSSAYLWDGRERYETAAGYGH